MTFPRFRIRQCRSWCCITRPHAARWWDVGIFPGNYECVDSWAAAISMADEFRRIIK